MNRRQRKAFTLIELLVVIAVIAILAALLLPALAAAKRKAQQVQCLSDMRQWGLGFRWYADDNGEMFPLERGGKGTALWGKVADAANSDVWYNAVPPHMGISAASHYAAYPSSRYDFYKRSSLFTCPAAKLPKNAEDAALFSRAMNARLIIGTAITRFFMLNQDTLTPLLLESGVTGEPSGDTQDNYDGRSYAKWDHSSARHDGRGNVLFGDGSARAVSGLELTNNESVAIQWDPTQ